MLREMNLEIYRGIFQKDYIPPELRLIAKLEELIEQHFKVHKDAGFYCEELRITERAMNKHLSFHRKQTVAKLIKLRAIHEAETLLVHSDMSVKQIAYELGFCDDAYLIRVIKEIHGVTPKKYRDAKLKEAFNPTAN